MDPSNSISQGGSGAASSRMSSSLSSWLDLSGSNASLSTRIVSVALTIFGQMIFTALAFQCYQTVQLGVVAHHILIPSAALVALGALYFVAAFFVELNGIYHFFRAPRPDLLQPTLLPQAPPLSTLERIRGGLRGAFPNYFDSAAQERPYLLLLALQRGEVAFIENAIAADIALPLYDRVNGDLDEAAYTALNNEYVRLSNRSALDRVRDHVAQEGFPQYERSLVDDRPYLLLLAIQEVENTEERQLFIERAVRERTALPGEAVLTAPEQAFLRESVVAALPTFSDLRAPIDGLKCPFSGEIMTHPVMLREKGEEHRYDRDVIRELEALYQIALLPTSGHDGTDHGLKEICERVVEREDGALTVEDLSDPITFEAFTSSALLFEACGHSVNAHTLEGWEAQVEGAAHMCPHCNEERAELSPNQAIVRLVEAFMVDRIKTLLLALDHDEYNRNAENRLAFWESLVGSDDESFISDLVARCFSTGEGSDLDELLLRELPSATEIYQTLPIEDQRALWQGAIDREEIAFVSRFLDVGLPEGMELSPAQRERLGTLLLRALPRPSSETLLHTLLCPLDREEATEDRIMRSPVFVNGYSYEREHLEALYVRFGMTMPPLPEDKCLASNTRYIRENGLLQAIPKLKLGARGKSILTSQSCGHSVTHSTHFSSQSNERETDLLQCGTRTCGQRSKFVEHRTVTLLKGAVREASQAEADRVAASSQGDEAVVNSSSIAPASDEEESDGETTLRVSTQLRYEWLKEAKQASSTDHSSFSFY